MQSTTRLSCPDLIKTLREGQPQFGTFLNGVSPIIAEQLSNSRIDWVLVDNQHSPCNLETSLAMLKGARLGNANTFVRVDGPHDMSGIQKSLDCGADGVVVPYVNSVEEVKKAVSACYFTNSALGTGHRSIYNPLACNLSNGFANYATTSNDNVLVGIQIETAEAIENIEEIAKIPGIHMLFVGRFDLGVSLKLHEKYGLDFVGSEEMEAAISKVVAAAKANNLILGGFTFGTDVQYFLNKGFRFLSIGNDLSNLVAKFQQNADELREQAKTAGLEWNGRDSNLVN